VGFPCAERLVTELHRVQVWRPKNLHPVQLGNSGPVGPAPRGWRRCAASRGTGGDAGPAAPPGRRERRCPAGGSGGTGGAVLPAALPGDGPGGAALPAGAALRGWSGRCRAAGWLISAGTL
jgi:hypothetical protein